MRKTLSLLTIILCIIGCSQKPVDPAASAPNFPLQVERFDSAFFEMDTLHMQVSLDKLQTQFPNFTTDFITKILMIKSVQDTQVVKRYLSTYMPIYKEALKVNAIKIVKPNLEDAFKHIHYFFPKYALSHKLTLFVGPLELYGNIITKDAVAIGLQMYLGENSSWYQTERMQAIYPKYVSKRFTPDYITVNALENIIDELPALQESNNLLNQLIAAGKKQYILKACLPNVQDAILFGYTNEQFADLKKEEAKIWENIVAEKLIYSTNETDIIDIMQEDATSKKFGDAFPGNVGKYIGYKIVEAWMKQKEQATINFETLMQTPAQKIFTNAKYAP